MDANLNRRKVILLTINGWGVASTFENNAIRKANIIDFKNLVANYPSTIINPVFDKLSQNYFCLGSGSKKIDIIFHNSLSKIIEDNNLKQVKIADSENFPLVSVFFNNQEDKLINEDWKIVNRKKTLLEYFYSFDELITKNTINFLKSGNYNFILANLSDISYSALSGDFQKTIYSIEKTSIQLKKIAKAVLEEDAVLVVLGTFGIAEDMFNVNTKIPNLKKTKNPVPLLIIGKEFEGKTIGLEEAPNNDLSLIKPQGDFSDIAPTILKIMGLEIYPEMTGESFV